MKILNPNNTTHNFVITPRFEPTISLSLELINEVTDEVFDLVNSYFYSNGVLNIIFDLEVKESDRYSIKITQDNKVIYRGKAFVTSQDTQDYKLTKDKYTYA